MKLNTIIILLIFSVLTGYLSNFIFATLTAKDFNIKLLPVFDFYALGGVFVLGGIYLLINEFSFIKSLIYLFLTILLGFIIGDVLYFLMYSQLYSLIIENKDIELYNPYRNGVLISFILVLILNRFFRKK